MAVHRVVDEVVSASSGSKKKLNQEIGGELMELTRAVVKKHTFAPEKGYKFHLAQPSRMLSRSVVQWNKSIVRKLRRRTNGSAPWTVRLKRHMPLEVFLCFKTASLTEETGGVLTKNTKNIEEIQFHNEESFKRFLLGLANKYAKCIREDDMMFKMEKDNSYSRVIINQAHPATFHYSKPLEMLQVKTRYGHYNRLGVPQFTLN